MEFLDTAIHPKYEVAYKDAVYLPMVELVRMLQDNGFKVFICSGGGAAFIRGFSESLYGIPTENVIGSSVKVRFEDGEAGSRFIRLPELAVINDGPQKPIQIEMHIGKEPIFAFGNSDGDIEMLELAERHDRPFLALTLHHDDSNREFAYDERAEGMLAKARARGWTVVSMTNDFRKVFSFQQ
jgi:hypothetical protein